jgi:hypothetical protein
LNQKFQPGRRHAGFGGASRRSSQARPKQLRELHLRVDLPNKWSSVPIGNI